jgi:hypothetical protein
MYVKAALFVAIGIAASALVLIERPTLRVALCLAIAVWAFARAYYFAFYVIEHYIDGRYKFSGLFSFLRYVVGRAGRRQPPNGAASG